MHRRKQSASGRVLVAQSTSPTMKKEEDLAEESDERHKKEGFLFKQSAGGWKRKRWNQRWFTLDLDSGVLSYSRHKGDTSHETIYLKEKGVMLVVQGDMPRGVPTPCCFSVLTSRNRDLRVCADNKFEFQEWTSAISSIIRPKKAFEAQESESSIVPSEDEDSNFHQSSVTNPIDFLSSAMTVTDDVNGKGAWDEREKNVVLTVLAVHPLIAIIKMLSPVPVFYYSSAVLLNAFFLWLLLPFESNHTSPPNQPPQSDSKFTPVDHVHEEQRQEVETPVKTSKPQLQESVVAGTSIERSEKDDGTQCWTELDASRFNVRKGPNYRRTKTKEPSGPGLLQIVDVDVFRSSTKLDNVGSLFDLSQLSTTREDRDLLIVNCQVPDYDPPNPLWGERVTNGPGYNFVTYFEFPSSVRASLGDEQNADPPIRLLRRFLANEPGMRDRFKAMGLVVNAQDQKLGRTQAHLVETYNGQPVLTRPQHRFYEGQGYMEVDVDVHEFNYIARKALAGVSEHLRHMVLDFGFVLEGQEDEELPEQILGSVRVCRVDVANARFIS